MTFIKSRIQIINDTEIQTIVMSKEIANKITDWNQYYIDTENETMSWYCSTLDKDVKIELEKRKINSGTFLDLGTGPGTQASELANLGFEVTGTDISAKAVEKASKLFKNVSFIQDNVLDTKLTNTFDYIMDRGCFHVFKPEQRPTFAKNVHSLIKPGGLYFLKCFSHKQEGTRGPQRVSPKEIHQTFGKLFNIISITDSVFDGENSYYPKALFVVMGRK